MVKVSWGPSVEPWALVALTLILNCPVALLGLGNWKLKAPVTGSLVVVTAGLNGLPLPSSNSTVTPGSVTPVKCGLKTLVMLSPLTPESSAGSIVKTGAMSGPDALMVKFKTGLVLEPLEFVALAWT